jgi:hypothetical protein
MNIKILEKEIREKGGIDIELEEKKKNGEVTIIKSNGKIISIIYHDKKKEPSLNLDELIDLIDFNSQTNDLNNLI